MTLILQVIFNLKAVKVIILILALLIILENLK